MTFPITAGEIDTLAAEAQHPVGYEMTKFFRQAANASEVSIERREALGLVGYVLGLSSHLYSQSNSQGLGRSVHGESPENLTKDQAGMLAALASEIQTAEVKAVLADAAWQRARGNPEIARLAVAAYIDSARVLEDPKEWSQGFNRAERAVRLGRSLGADDPSFRLAADYVVEIVGKYRGEDPLFLTGKAIELLLEFEIGDPVEYAEHALRGANGALTRKNYHLARYYFDLLAKINRRRGDEDAINAALREFAKTFEAEAHLREADSNLAAAHFYTQAIQAYRRVPDSDAEIEAIRPHLRRAERASIAEFKRIEGEPISIAEFANQARQHVSGRDLRESILRFAHIVPLTDPDKARAAAIESIRLAPLHHLSATGIKDSEGRTVGIAPAASMTDSGGDESVFAEIVQQMTVQRDFFVHAYIQPALTQVLLEHTVTLSDLIGLCVYSPFVPQGHERIFAEGLHAGFQGDFLVATHLLVPQIENSVRHLMQEKGITTTKIDRFGVQRNLDLSDLVVHEQFESILPNDVRLELRALFTDNRGPNLRHSLAHGMLSDAAFGSAEALFAWWLVLRLCLFAPVPRMDETSPSSKEPA